MGRMTRAKAAQVAEELHVDEDAVLDSGLDLKMRTPERDERAPLGEIAPNSGSGQEEESEVADMRKSTRGRKGGKKGVKGKKTNLAASTASTATQPETLEETEDVMDDVREAVFSPASEAAADPELDPKTNGTEHPETESTSLHIKLPATSQSMVSGPTSPLPVSYTHLTLPTKRIV